MKEESLLLLSDLQKLINQVVLIDYTIIILGGETNMEKVRCPYCGFIAHRVCSNDGVHWRYICERCHRIFVVD